MDGQTDGQTDRFAISISRDSMLTLDKKTKNKIWQKTIFNTADWILTPCNVARSWHWFRQVTALCNVICGSEMTCHWILPVAASCNVTRSSGIMTLNSPGGSTLQGGRWLWDDMPLNSPKRPPYWNSTFGFDFNFTAVDMSFCASRRNFIQIGPPAAEKNDVMSIFKMADLSHLGF